MKIVISTKFKAVLTLIGGFFLLLTNGSIFLWGQLNVYVTSYFRQKEDAGLDLSIGGALFPVMMASLATGIPFGIKLLKFFGSARVCLLISVVTSSMMVILSSFAQRFYQFIIIYGVIGGFAQGTVYFVPIYMGYLYLPNNKGLVAGINTCGFALNAFFFGLLFFHQVNPQGLPQISNHDGYSYFEGSSIEVARNVPEAIRTLGYIFLSVSVVASQLIMYHPNQIGEEEKRLKRQLDNKEKEIKDLNQLKQKIQEVDSNFKKNNDQIPQETLQTESIQKDQQLLNKHIHLAKLEEELIQQQILRVNHEDQQKEQVYIYPEILDQFTQNQSDSENQIFHHHNLVQFMQQDHPNKDQHKNSFISVVSCKNEQELQLYLQSKEKQVEQNLIELKIKNKLAEEQLNQQGAPSIAICLKQPQFYMSIFLGFLSIGFGLLINGNYKPLAKDYGFTNDSFQSLVGSISGIANGLCRPMWSTLLDKFSFKRVLQVLLTIEIITSLSLQSTHINQVFFILWICIIHMTLGGTLGMWPVFSSQINGVKIGSQLYGFYWYGFTLANLLQFLLVLYTKKSIGFNKIFYIYFAQAFVALCIITFYNFKVNWSKHYISTPKTQQSQTIFETQLQSEPVQQLITLAK
ncbi:oxalate/formate antiporter (macronuclear) [Tetrahymena thermophila SB210]|uniref:Oxalate/formate antiporter n=1 Tax=Tetrahymena thermophila (strain SB210) TaxID=312017 RepID=Q22BG0_TETTS|nr:oxalate/formate antiporter [Tetrahymena thermophila SB210]EAR82644.1 oxalate/formate antiporter [Tetrahymena thermophila SB210]|eukprot:XP_001030307.1 oxalate/formate antiporter [Tetrahymena thermophila SB210]